MISRPGPRLALLEAVAPRASIRLGRAVRAASVLFVAALTAAAAQVSLSLPFTEVPFTLQPVVVVAGAVALGPRLAVASQMLYLVAGIAGLPVFAASALLPQGAARLFGPTGGYLMAYPLAAFVAGWLGSRGFDRRYGTSVLAMLAGLAVVFAGGVLWLSRFVGLEAALAAGFYPFLVADVLKAAAAGALLPRLRQLLGAR